MDEFEEIKKIVLDEINNKKWYELTIDEIEMIEDPKKRKEYMEKVKDCVKHIINPLHSAVNAKKHEITKETCKGIIEDLIKICKKHGMTKEDIRNIIMERHQKK